MDISGIRQKNLISLLGKYQLQQEFCRAIPVSTTTVSLVKNGSKKMGSRLARQIETSLGLQPGWMDRSHETNEDQSFVCYKIPMIQQRQVYKYITQREWIEPEIKGSPVAFSGPPNRYAVVIEDDSMAPALSTGSGVAVDPDSQPVRGKPAIYTSRDGGTIIGRYMEMNRSKYLTFDNPRYPTAEILPDMVYAGLVTHRLTEEV